MPRLVIAFGALAALVTLSTAAFAEEPGKIDLETAELAADLVGAPVYAADGPEVGRVADVASDEDGSPQAVRILTDANLGFGPRTITVGRQLFTALQGAIVIDLPAEAVHSLPEISDPQ
jgi:hypothetical protein